MTLTGLLGAHQLDNHLNLHLEFCRRELTVLVCEQDLEELVLANKDNMVVLRRLRLLRGVCGLGRVMTRMKANEHDVTEEHTARCLQPFI